MEYFLATKCVNLELKYNDLETYYDSILKE
jgi:hypothetical protein